MRSNTNDTLPISEAQFARIIRSSVGEVREFALSLPEGTRARLALFCYARAHLRDVGLTIAVECSHFSLTCEGSHAGGFLFEQAKSRASDHAFGSGRRAVVSLSTSSARFVEPVVS